MLRVAFDLRWPSVVRFDQQAHGLARMLENGGIEVRFAGDETLNAF